MKIDKAKFYFKIEQKTKTNYKLYVWSLTLNHTIPTLNELSKEAFWKHCCKTRKCWLLAFSLFPTMISTLSKTANIILSTAVYQHYICCLKMLLIWFWAKIFSFIRLNKAVNPFPNKPWFLHVCITSLLKTLWEKEKLLVTSNFPFSHSVFYPFEDLSFIFYQI